MSGHPGQGLAVVTGASSGIGEVYADRLAKRGYDLLLVARNVERLGALRDKLAGDTHRRVDIMVADLCVRDDLLRLEQRLLTDPTITLLVNNAGLLVNGPLAEADPNEIQSTLEVNVIALTRLSAAAADNFTAQKRGGIINLSSAMALTDTPGAAVYGAAKAYVLNLTLSLDLELRPHGVQVQAVLPGYTRTPMIGNGARLPDKNVMEVSDLVDAALAGFDQDEVVTIPSLPDLARLEDWKAARVALRPFLSLNQSAARYGIRAVDPPI